MEHKLIVKYKKKLQFRDLSIGDFFIYNCDKEIKQKYSSCQLLALYKEPKIKDCYLNDSVIKVEPTRIENNITYYEVLSDNYIEENK